MTEATEKEIAAVSTAPRITPADIEANIVSEHYFTGADGVNGPLWRDDAEVMLDPASPLNLLTFCVLVLRNGFTVTGQSACASSENFNAVVGKRIARDDAIRQVWPLMGYELRTKLAARAQYGTAIAGTPRFELGELDGKTVYREGVTGQPMPGWKEI